ncbi:hypothetical protein [Bacillus phage vB_BanS-Thrax5]|nr:hypothetical protein [Bacillus phage vB_BanS-Thrax5]
MPPKFRLTKEQELEVIKRYNNGDSIRKIAEDYPVGRTSIGYVLQRYNVQRKGQGNSYGYSKYTVNQDYFETIDTEEKAYWLGFISADGHVSDDGVTIGLSEVDENHLIKFLKHIGSNTKIRRIESTKAVVINVYSKKMVSDLRKLGLYKNKSKTQTFPTIDKSLHRHFIRGVFDGDGTMTKNVVSFCGSFDMISEIKKLMLEMFDLRNTKIIRKGEILSIINWYRNRHLILDYMYSDANIFLERKYQKYKEVKL